MDDRLYRNLANITNPGQVLRLDIDLTSADNIRRLQQSDVLAPFINLLYLTINEGGEAITQLPNLPQSVVYLSCSDNQLTALPDTLPPSLRQLFCNNNMIEQLPERLPASLVSFMCNNNLIEHLPELPPGLLGFSCNSNLLAVLPQLPNSLMGLSCNDNRIENLPNALPQHLSELSCSKNLLRVIPPLPQGFRMLNCSHNMLTVLPMLPPTLTSLTCSFNQITELPPLPAGLKQLICNNNQLTNLPQLPRGMTTFQVANNPIPPETRALIAAELRTGRRPDAVGDIPPARPAAELRPRVRVRPPSPPYPPPNMMPDPDFDAFVAQQQQQQMPPRRTRPAPLISVETIYEDTPAQPLSTATNVSTPSPNTTGFDPIQYGPQKLDEFIQEDPADNFAFVIHNEWYLLNANNIIQHQVNNPNIIRYKCHAESHELVPNINNIDITTPYITIRGLGVPAEGVIPLAQLKYVLTSNRTPPYYTMVNTGTSLVTTISASMFNHNANAISSAHCQAGQGQPVFELQHISQQGGKRRHRNRTHRRRRNSRSRKNRRNHRKKLTFKRRQRK